MLFDIFPRKKVFRMLSPEKLFPFPAKSQMREYPESVLRNAKRWRACGRGRTDDRSAVFLALCQLGG
jgi:hypothetical protein